MSLRISGKHMEIGDSFRTKIEGRVGEAVTKYFDGGYAGHVTVEKSGSRFTATAPYVSIPVFRFRPRGRRKTRNSHSTRPPNVSKSA